MLALDTIKQEMTPRLDTLIEHLAVSGEARAGSFFAQIRCALTAVEEEADLLEVFFALSTTAFQGFTLDPFAASLTDDVLAYAEQIAQAFMASTDVTH
jgi:hypothetical protein